MTVTHERGIFTSRTLPPWSPDVQILQGLNREVIAAMGMVRGVTHAEFIRGHEDGRFYFLEAVARVGGAHIDRMVEVSSGLNLWVECARIEVAHARGEPYQLPATRQHYARLILSLARQEWPDASAYADREIV